MPEIASPNSNTTRDGTKLGGENEQSRINQASEDDQAANTRREWQ
jgi:hypothetical protein